MGRAPCCDKASVKKGPWSPEEDAKLKSYIEKHGTGGNWIALPQKIGLKRCGKSCRLRWLNYLRPNIKHGGFSEEEDNFICSLYLSIGSRWSIIAAQLPGRTDNDIKNYWNTRLKKKLLGKQRKATIQRTTRSVVSCFKQEFSDHHIYMPNINSNIFLDDFEQPPPVALPTTTTTTKYHEEEELVYCGGGGGGGNNNSHDLSSNGMVTNHDSCSLHPTHVLCSGGNRELVIPPCLQPNNSFHDLSTCSTTTTTSSSSVSFINSPTTSLLMPTYCPLIINSSTSFQYLISSGSRFDDDDYDDNRTKQTTLECFDGINIMNNINMVINGNSCTTTSPSPSPEDISSSIVSCDPAVFNHHEISQPPVAIPQDFRTFQESTQTT